MQSPSLASLIGQQVGNYKVIRELGRGGMGVVYEASHTAIGYRAAMKVLSSKLASDPKHKVYVSRFLDEARAVNLINHPGVVRVFDMDQIGDGTVYILMEFVEGQTLFARLVAMRDGRMPRMTVAQAVRIIRQCAAAMAAAHDKGILHRDLKPDNIVVTPDDEAQGKERVKILDFGLARFLDSPERRTTAGVALGTPTYMSPEQCMGDELDGKSDVYSLGVILYELLCGEVPFPGEEMGKVMRRHVDEAPKLLATRVPGLDAGAAALCHSMLEKRRDLRPDMRQVQQRIEDLERTGKLDHATAVALTPASASTARSPEAPTMASPLLRRNAAPATELVQSLRVAKPKPAFSALLVVAGLVAGLGLGLALMRNRDVPQCPPVPPVKAQPAPAKCPEPAVVPAPAGGSATAAPEEADPEKTKKKGKASKKKPK